MQQQKIGGGERAKAVEQMEIGKLAVKVKEGVGKSGSKNRFALFESVEEKDEEGRNEEEIIITKVVEVLEEKVQVEPRKTRAAAKKVVDLMKSLKAKRKGPIDKWKAK